VTAKQLQGKELSYNNIADADAAWECVKSFDTPACVIVKHANPCGVAVGANALEAYSKAFQTDPTSRLRRHHCAEHASWTKPAAQQIVQAVCGSADGPELHGRGAGSVQEPRSMCASCKSTCPRVAPRHWDQGRNADGHEAHRLRHPAADGRQP